ncbi:hypothetical protein [Bifidobacterium tissieri]|uniref:hypothetical protein n=1 Tax=Bifidobacterium tissieri TaxID=1630162 RepID=UPI0012398FE2|nr:hypothetical protein [Bifidobacterium tissieri]KAA8828660.1 hypothetical protein EM849_11525 [Bifidobacterium tissieri]
MTGIDLDTQADYIRKLREGDKTLRVCRKCGGRFPRLHARMLCGHCYGQEPDIRERHLEYKRAAYWANPERFRQRSREYRQTHREQIREYRRGYQVTHGKHLREYSAAYRNAHRDEINARKRAYWAAHRDEINARRRARRAAKRQQEQEN